MNRYARAIGMENTTYNNPHGLGDKNNKSTAADLGKLACVCMQDPIFRDLTSRRIYKCQGINVKGNEVKERNYSWWNNNELLGRGFNGVKTGWTPNAGSCHAASYEKDGLHLIIILIDCKDKKVRFVEAPKLTLWAVNRLNKFCEFFGQG